MKCMIMRDNNNSDIQKRQMVDKLLLDFRYIIMPGKVKNKT